LKTTIQQAIAAKDKGVEESPAKYSTAGISKNHHAESGLMEQYPASVA
jgi:hypothetical protein